MQQLPLGRHKGGSSCSKHAAEAPAFAGFGFPASPPGPSPAAFGGCGGRSTMCMVTMMSDPGSPSTCCKPAH